MFSSENKERGSANPALNLTHHQEPTALTIYAHYPPLHV